MKMANKAVHMLRISLSQEETASLRDPRGCAHKTLMNSPNEVAYGEKTPRLMNALRAEAALLRRNLLI